jgi:hypothetical protein
MSGSNAKKRGACDCYSSALGHRTPSLDLNAPFVGAFSLAEWPALLLWVQTFVLTPGRHRKHNIAQSSVTTDCYASYLRIVASGWFWKKLGIRARASCSEVRTAEVGASVTPTIPANFNDLRSLYNKLNYAAEDLEVYPE